MTLAASQTAQGFSEPARRPIRARSARQPGANMEPERLGHLLRTKCRHTERAGAGAERDEWVGDGGCGERR